MNIKYLFDSWLCALATITVSEAHSGVHKEAIRMKLAHNKSDVKFTHALYQKNMLIELEIGQPDKCKCKLHT